MKEGYSNIRIGMFLEIATTLGALGGAFLAVFGWLLRRHALVPVGDPRLAESLAFENV